VAISNSRCRPCVFSLEWVPTVFVCDAMGRDCFGLPQGTGLVHAQRMCLLLWVAVSLVGADRLAHARNRTPLPSSCSSSPRFATEPTDRTQLRVLHAADPHTTASAAVVVTTARDGCHALARPMNHAAARLTLPGGCVMTSFLLHIESPDRHYCQTKPATCTVRSRRHGHSKASARAIRAGLDITAQGGWRCTCLHMSDSVPAHSPIRSHCLSQPTVAELLLPQFLLPATRRAQWALHVTSTRPFLLPLSQPTVAELLLPQFLLPAIRRAQWALHVTSTSSSLSQPTVAELLLPQFLLPAIRRAQWALHVTSTRSFLLPLSQPTVAELLLPQFLLPAIRRAQWALHVTSTSSSRRPHAFVHPYYATLGCRETRAALVTGPSSGRGGG
jgi:hypothetical protein